MKMKIFTTVILALLLSSCKTGSNKPDPSQKQQLEGQWELNEMKSTQQKLTELYPGKKPFIKFDLEQNVISGNNGCNSFSGKMDVNGNKINLKGPMTATKMYCEGQGENIFMENLNKAETYSVSKDGKTLKLTEKGTSFMSFIKK